MTNWRALCEELVEALEIQLDELRFDNRLCNRARAALAQPEPEVVGPSVEELDDLFNEIDQSGEPLSWRAYARAVLSRWGRPAPAPAGEVAELVAWLRAWARGTLEEGQPATSRSLTRIADLLEQRQAAPVPVLPEDAQVIEPTEHTILVPAPVPVAVSERLPGLEDCDAEHYCWRWSTIGRLWVRQQLARSWYEFESHWLPAHALPLPSVEVG